MKPECRAKAERLLGLDNRLAIANCDLAHKDFGGVKQGLQDAATQAKLLAQDGIISPRIVPIFDFVAKSGQECLDQDNIEEVKRLLEALHEFAEELLLQSVIDCECRNERTD